MADTRFRWMGRIVYGVAYAATIGYCPAQPVWKVCGQSDACFDNATRSTSMG
jgi:hypothetical protein